MEIKHETFDFIISELNLVLGHLKKRQTICNLVADIGPEEVARIWGLAHICEQVSEEFRELCKHP
jgi:hypothetical protein